MNPMSGMLGPTGKVSLTLHQKAVMWELGHVVKVPKYFRFLPYLLRLHSQLRQFCVLMAHRSYSKLETIWKSSALIWNPMSFSFYYILFYFNISEFYSVFILHFTCILFVFCFYFTFILFLFCFFSSILFKSNIYFVLFIVKCFYLCVIFILCHPAFWAIFLIFLWKCWVTKSAVKLSFCLEALSEICPKLNKKCAK